MKRKLMMVFAASGFTALTLPAFASTAVGSGSMASFGVAADHTDYSVSGYEDDTNGYGAYVDYGNIMTGGAGYIYNVGIDYTMATESSADINSYDFGGDLGYRLDLDRHTFADIVLGLGYERVKFDYDDAPDERVKNPYAKLGLAIGTDFDDFNTGRIEVGTRYTYNGEVSSGDSDFDLKDRGNFYAEASLVNTATGVPIQASLFHRNSDIDIDLDGASSIDRSITGLRLGVML